VTSFFLKPPVYIYFVRKMTVLEKKMAKLISLNIPEQVYEKVRENRWNHAEIYLLGIKAKFENPQMLSRIHELEAGNIKLQRHLTALSERVTALQAEKGA